MSKLAVFLFACVAIYAASAHKHHVLDTDYDVERFEKFNDFDYDTYIIQIRKLTTDLTHRLRDITDDKEHIKILTWECHTLLEFIDTVVEKFENKELFYGKDIDRVYLYDFVKELREIQVILRRFDVMSFDQVKEQLVFCIHKIYENFDKFFTLFRMHYSETQGSLTYVVRSVIVDFLKVLRDFDIKFQTVFDVTRTTETTGLVELGMKIEYLTRDLIKVFDNTYLNDAHVKVALRQFLNHLEVFKTELKENYKHIDVEFITLFEDMYKRFYDVILPVVETTKYDRFVKIDLWKREFITVLETINKDFLRFCERYETKYSSTEYYYVFEKILKNYLFTIYQFKTDLTKDLVKDVYYNKDFYGKTDLKTGLFGLEHKTDMDMNVYKKTGKGLTMQLYTVIDKLCATLDRIYLDNVVVKDTLFHLIKVYTIELENIIEKLETVETYHKDFIYNLKELVMTMKHILDDKYTFNSYELKNHIKLTIRKFAEILDRYTMIWQTKYQVADDKFYVLKNLIVRFLTVTRNFEMNLMNMGQLVHKDKTYYDFGTQIQILVRDFILNLKTIDTTDNMMIQKVLVARVHDFTLYLRKIIEKLERFDYNIMYEHEQVYKTVLFNLKHIVDKLERIEYIDNVTELKHVFIVCLEDTVTEMQKLLFIWQNCKVEGLKTFLYEVLSDFIYVLKNYQIKLHDVYYKIEYGVGLHQLHNQISIITNNLGVYLKNIRDIKVHNTEFFVEWIRKFTHTIELIVERLETEVTYTDKTGVYYEVISELKRICEDLHKICEYDVMKIDYKYYTDLYYILQKTSTQLKKLAYFCQYDTELHGHVEEVVRSALMHYLVVIQHLQIDFHRVNHYYHIGTTVDEMKLQIEVVCERLLTLLRFDVPVTKDLTLVWHLRRLYTVMDRMVDGLKLKQDLFEDKYFDNLMYTLTHIKTYLYKCIHNVDDISVHELRINFLTVVEEIKKNLWINFEHRYVKDADVFFKNMLVDFLYELQYCELYFQNTLLYFRGEQNPRDLVHQIDFVADRLTTLFKYTWPTTDKVREILVIQVADLCDTIQNLIHLLKVEIKNNGDKNDMLHEVIVELTKVSTHLYRFNMVQDRVDIHELLRDFDMSIRNVVLVFRKLGYGIEEMRMLNLHGVLNGVFNHYLVCLRNIYIQLDTFKRFGLYYKDTTELLNQINTITNHVTNTLEFVNLSDKHLKQAFVIQTLKYAHRVHNIIEKLNILKRMTTTDVYVIEKVILHLREIIVSLQQVGTTVDTTNTTVLRNWLNNKIVSVNAEIEKLLMINFTQHNDKECITLVRSILIDYFTTVQNLKLCIDNVNMINQKGLTVGQLVYHLEFMINDLSYCLRNVVITDKFVKDTLLVEFHKLDKIIEIIYDKIYKAIEGEHKTVYLGRIVDELKELHLMVRQFTTSEFTDLHKLRINYELYLHRTTTVLRKLVYVLRPEIETHFNFEVVDFVKSIYVDLFDYIQNFEILCLNVLQRDYIKQYAMEMTYVRDHMDVLGDYRKFDDVKLYNMDTTNTYELFVELKKMVLEFNTMIREFDTLKTQEDLHLFKTEIRKLVYIVETLISKLREYVVVAKGDVMVLNRIIERLDTTLGSLKHFMGYTTFNGFEGLKTECIKFLFVFVEQLEQLVKYHEEYQGTFDVVFKNLIKEFLMTLRTIKYQFRFGYDKNMMYNKDYKYGFDKTYDYDYDYSMKYNKDVDRFDNKYGKMDLYTMNKKFDFGLKDDTFKYTKGENFDELVKFITIFCDKLIKDVEILDKQDVFVYYVRDLIKIVDEIIERFEGIVTVDNKVFVYRFIENLRFIKKDLYQLVHTGTITTVYQTRTQYIYNIRKISNVLVGFVRDYTYLIHENKTMIYDIFHQYLVYLRTVHMKLQKVGDFDIYRYDVKDYDITRDVHIDNLRLREFVQDIKYIIDKVQSKIYLIRGKDLVIVRQVLLKLREILKEINEYDIKDIKYDYLRKMVEDVTYDIKNWMTIVEEYGVNHDMYIIAKDVLFDFRRCVQKLFFQDKDLIHLWA